MQWIAIVEQAIEQSIDALIRPVGFAMPGDEAQHVEIVEMIRQAIAK